MKFNFSPFSNSKKRHSFKPVGNKEIGMIYMKSVGGIYPIERSEEVQKLEADIAAAKRSQISMLWTMKTISDREAKETGITPSEAQAKIFGGPQVTAENEETSVTVVKKSPIDYVKTEDELKALLASGAEDEETKILERSLKRLVATSMMKTRLGWVVSAIKNNKGEYQIALSEPLRFHLPIGTQIRFDTTTVTVGGEGGEEGEFIIPLDNKLLTSFAGNGFIQEDGQDKVGTEWDMEKTNTLLFDSQIDAIYEFFLLEDGGGEAAIAKAEDESSEQDEEERVGNLSEPLKEEALPPSSTGETSSSESKPVVVAIAG